MLFAFALLSTVLTLIDDLAEQIGITRHGVKAHLAIVFERLGASSRTEAASIALSLGLI